MAVQFVLTVEFPRVSFDVVTQRASAQYAVTTRLAEAWPPSARALHHPTVSAAWRADGDHLSLTWS